jgi:hypothetical protein
VIEVLVNGQWVKLQYGWCGDADICPFGIIDMDATTVTLRSDTRAGYKNDRIAAMKTMIENALRSSD